MAFQHIRRIGKRKEVFLKALKWAYVPHEIVIVIWQYNKVIDRFQNKLSKWMSMTETNLNIYYFVHLTHTTNFIISHIIWYPILDNNEETRESLPKRIHRIFFNYVFHSLNISSVDTGLIMLVSVSMIQPVELYLHPFMYKSD